MQNEERTIGRLNCLAVAHKALRFDSKMIQFFALEALREYRLQMTKSTSLNNSIPKLLHISEDL